MSENNRNQNQNQETGPDSSINSVAADPQNSVDASTDAATINLGADAQLAAAEAANEPVAQHNSAIENSAGATATPAATNAVHNFADANAVPASPTAEFQTQIPTNDLPEPQPASAKKASKPVSWLTPLWASVAAAGIAIVAFVGGAGTAVAATASEDRDRSGEFNIDHTHEHEGRDGEESSHGGRGDHSGMGGGPHGGKPGDHFRDSESRGSEPGDSEQNDSGDMESRNQGGGSEQQNDTDTQNYSDRSGGDTTQSSSTQSTAWVIIS